MSGAKERELKLSVPTEADLARLEAEFGGTPDAIVQQHNVYFDADRRLSDARWSLRLRREEGRAVLTLKGPRDDGGQRLVSRPETPDVEVDAETADRILAGDDDLLDHLAAGLDGDDLEYVATARAVLDGRKPIVWCEMKNERRKYPLVLSAGTLTLEVDRTDYGRFGRFFEVELEIPADFGDQEATAWLEGRFSALGLDLVEAPGKLVRLQGFLDAET